MNLRAILDGEDTGKTITLDLRNLDELMFRIEEAFPEQKFSKIQLNQDMTEVSLTTT